MCLCLLHLLSLSQGQFSCLVFSLSLVPLFSMLNLLVEKHHSIIIREIIEGVLAMSLFGRLLAGSWNTISLSLGVSQRHGRVPILGLHDLNMVMHTGANQLASPHNYDPNLHIIK